MLAEGLGVEYDDLVSISMTGRLGQISELFFFFISSRFIPFSAFWDNIWKCDGAFHSITQESRSTYQHVDGDFKSVWHERWVVLFGVFASLSRITQQLFWRSWRISWEVCTWAEMDTPFPTNTGRINWNTPPTSLCWCKSSKLFKISWIDGSEV